MWGGADIFAGTQKLKPIQQQQILVKAQGSLGDDHDRKNDDFQPADIFVFHHV